MTNRSLLVALILAALATPVVAASPEAGAEGVTLLEAVAAALEHNRELAAMEYFVDAQRHRVGAVRSSLLPRVEFSERFTRTNNPPAVFSTKLNQQRFSQSDFDISSLNDPSPVSDFQTTLSFFQPIFHAQAVMATKAARSAYSATRLGYERKREETALAVIENYLRVITARGMVEVAEKGVQDAREHLRIARARERAGLGLYSDVLRAKTALSEALRREVSARKDLEVARMALAVTMGDTEPVDAAGDVPDIEIGDFAHYREASAGRDDVRAAEMWYETAKRRLRAEQSGYLPTVGFGASFQMNDRDRPFGSEGTSWSVMATLRWEIFAGGARHYRAARAASRVKEAEREVEGLKQRVALVLYDSYLAVDEARKRLDLARSALETAEEGARLVELRYKNSLAPLVDLLDAQLNLDRARASVVASRNDYLMAKYRLLFESGTLLDELGLRNRIEETGR